MTGFAQINAEILSGPDSPAKRFLLRKLERERHVARPGTEKKDVRGTGKSVAQQIEEMYSKPLPSKDETMADRLRQPPASETAGPTAFDPNNDPELQGD